MSDPISMLIVAGPIVIAVGAIFLAIYVATRRRTPQRPLALEIARWVGVALLLLVSLGIGTCYAAFLNRGVK